jgi:hypothetical protein
VCQFGHQVPAVGIGHLGAHHFARPCVGAKNTGLHDHHGVEIVGARVSHDGKATH